MDRVIPYSSGVPKKQAPTDEAPIAGPTAMLLAENLKLMMKARPELNSNPKLGKASKLGPSAISRLVNGHNASLKTLEQVAGAFGLEAWQLLVPGFDPLSPPALRPLSEAERKLYLKLKALAIEAAKAT